MKKSEKIMNAILGVSFTPKYKRLSVTRHIRVIDRSLETEVPVLVEMIDGANGGRIMIPSNRIKSIFALGLSVRSKT